ncbi:MAG TPA: DUF4301 family protein [Thermodesulfobacteriota bacterium]|nr:DUF4301 family protein [Thermodesulfobacteriota bacterium]
MDEYFFNEEDLKQIAAKGISLQRIKSQIDIFKKGFPSVELDRPCTIADGIKVITETDLRRLGDFYSKESLSLRVTKFVPASGAASRMFKLLLSFNNRYQEIEEKDIAAKADKGDPEHKAFIRFIKGIRQLAFYDDLKSVMAENGLDIEVLISKGQYKEILDYILTPKGLNYADLPKGLIKFHRYPGGSRTPFEEHLVEAAAYTQEVNKVSRVHFTVPVEYHNTVQEHVEATKGRYEVSGVKFEISFSTQNPSTDTIAVDMDNKPYRDKQGRLVFRPAGHGALLENLNDLDADIAFIKNIDNVVPDRLKHVTYVYKRALGGYLIELQSKIFGYLKRLSGREFGISLLEQIFEFARNELSIIPPKAIERGSRGEKISFLKSKLNRPLRVCGMVKNEGEPGGGPFWVRNEEGSLSLQIVESSQIDMESPEQRAIWQSSTHFNPVDLVCSLRDYTGKPFDLKQYADPDTGFISIKSIDGEEVKALELPGLWNGSMAYWNTVFVEVPLITFNPVKTVLDLLREEHQAE